MVSPRVTHGVWAISALKDTCQAKTHLMNDTYLPTVSVTSQTKCLCFDSIGKCFKCRFVNTFLGNWIAVLNFTQRLHSAIRGNIMNPSLQQSLLPNAHSNTDEAAWWAAVAITGTVREMTGHMFDADDWHVLHISHTLSVIVHKCLPGDSPVCTLSRWRSGLHLHIETQRERWSWWCREPCTGPFYHWWFTRWH